MVRSTMVSCTGVSRLLAPLFVGRTTLEELPGNLKLDRLMGEKEFIAFVKSEIWRIKDIFTLSCFWLMVYEEKLERMDADINGKPHSMVYGKVSIGCWFWLYVAPPLGSTVSPSAPFGRQKKLFCNQSINRMLFRGCIVQHTDYSIWEMLD